MFTSKGCFRESSLSPQPQVRCWDLNTNKIIRTYHGHLSAVYSLKLHPTLDVLASGGRDGTVRIWDIRSRTQIFALQHEGAVNCIESQAAEPQFISGSADNTVLSSVFRLAVGQLLLVNAAQSISSCSESRFIDKKTVINELS